MSKFDDVVAHLPPEDRYAAASALARMIRRRAAAGEAAAPVPPAHKRCPSCGNELPTRAFRANAGRPDGLSGWCGACLSASDRSRRETQLSQT